MVPRIITDQIFSRLLDIMNRIKLNAKSLIYDYDSNFVERYNSMEWWKGILFSFLRAKSLNHAIILKILQIKLYVRFILSDNLVIFQKGISQIDIVYIK